MKSVLANGTEDDPEDDAEKAKGRSVPKEFDVYARKFVRSVRDSMSANEVRAMAADKTACPVLVVRPASPAVG